MIVTLQAEAEELRGQVKILERTKAEWMDACGEKQTEIARLRAENERLTLERDNLKCQVVDEREVANRSVRQLHALVKDFDQQTSRIAELENDRAVIGNRATERTRERDNDRDEITRFRVENERLRQEYDVLLGMRNEAGKEVDRLRALLKGALVPCPDGCHLGWTHNPRNPCSRCNQMASQHFGTPGYVPAGEP